VLALADGREALVTPRLEAKPGPCSRRCWRQSLVPAGRPEIDELRRSIASTHIRTPGRRFDHLFRPRHGIGPPQPNGVVGRSGGTVSENGMDVSEEETSRARNAVVA
jgi:hypothetical protein